MRARERRGDGDRVVDFIQETGLNSLLLAGTITWEHQSMDITSTVDLILGSKAVQEELVHCRIHNPDHSSDHKPIEIEVDISSAIEPPAQGKRLYKDAEWSRIRRKVLDRIGDGSVLSRIFDPSLLDIAASSFTNQVDIVLEEEVPKAKASPYAKRWWTKELTVLRDGFTEKRNCITKMRRRGEDVAEAIRAADIARRIYYDEIDRQKKQYWKDFLNNPDNIWKAARYAKGVNSTANIPTLLANNWEHKTDEEKAGILMSTFFPKQAEPVPAEQGTRQQSSRRENPTWLSLTRQEVEQAIFKSSPDKSLGSDDITFCVWRELWLAVGDHILWLYSNSLDLGHVPKGWKTARIVTIRKPGKADFTVPKAFRPIALLQTISKGLEAVVAARMSYLTERFNLLPANHFGGRPRRSAEQALNILVERIYQA